MKANQEKKNELLPKKKLLCCFYLTVNISKKIAYMFEN